MAVKVVRFEPSLTRNVPQDLSGDHRRVKSGRAERGSNWLQAPPAQNSVLRGK